METFETVKKSHADGDGHGFDKKAIIRTFWILLAITCVELIVGMFIAPHYHSLKIMFNVLYIILTLAKAFYIIAEFMHLGHEIKNLVMTIAVPALLFIWFITAFLWDGSSYNHLRNTYDPYYHERTTTPIKQTTPAHGHENHEVEKPGAVH